MLFMSHLVMVVAYRDDERKYVQVCVEHVITDKHAHPFVFKWMFFVEIYFSEKMAYGIREYIISKEKAQIQRRCKVIKKQKRRQ